MTTKKRRTRRRHFVLAFAAVLCSLLLFLGGAIIAEQNTQRLGFGDDRPAFSPYRQASGQAGLELNLFGYEADLDLTAPAAFLEKVGLSVNHAWQGLLQWVESLG